MKNIYISEKISGLISEMAMKNPNIVFGGSIALVCHDLLRRKVKDIDIMVVKWADAPDLQKKPYSVKKGKRSYIIRGVNIDVYLRTERVIDPVAHNFNGVDIWIGSKKSCIAFKMIGKGGKDVKDLQMIKFLLEKQRIQHEQGKL
jgi:hypothetical protein